MRRYPHVTGDCAAPISNHFRDGTELDEGEVLMRIIYLSLDPYMRGRMSAAKSYATPASIGHPMVGGTVARSSSRAIQTVDQNYPKSTHTTSR